MTEEIFYFIAITCLTSITVMVVRVSMALLNGDIELQLRPSEEITALYRLIHSLPGYARLRSPDEVRQADIDAQGAVEEAQQSNATVRGAASGEPTVRGAEDVA
jgi:hypothetical protein